MSTANPEPSPSEEFDDGLLERLGDVETYVSAAPSPVSGNAFSLSSARSKSWSLSALLAEADSNRERDTDAG